MRRRLTKLVALTVLLASITTLAAPARAAQPLPTTANTRTEHGSVAEIAPAAPPTLLPPQPRPTSAAATPLW